MASRSLSLGRCFALAALIVGATACSCGGDPQPPPTTPDLPDAALSKVEVNRTTDVLADGRDTVTITVTVVKQGGAALSGRTVKLEVSGGGNMLAPASGQTDAQGKLTATLASTSAGTKTVKASVDTDGGPVVLNAQPTVEFISPATRLEFTVPPGPVTAGTPFSVTVTAYDASNNVATGFTGTVQLTSSDPQAVLPGDFTFAASNAGTASLSVELRTAGTQTLSLAHGLSGSPLTASKTVEAASPARLAFSVQPANANVRTTLAEVRVGVTDAYGNATPASEPAGVREPLRRKCRRDAERHADRGSGERRGCLLGPLGGPGGHGLPARGHGRDADAGDELDVRHHRQPGPGRCGDLRERLLLQQRPGDVDGGGR